MFGRSLVTENKHFGLHDAPPRCDSLPVLNACLDHGLGPRGATYAYRVTSLATGTSAIDPSPVALVANTAKLQAVWHAGEQRGQAVLYEPGVVRFPDGQSIEPDRACILLYRPLQDGGVALTVADPAQQSGVIVLRLAGRCSASLSVTMPIREHAGASQTVSFNPA